MKARLTAFFTVAALGFFLQVGALAALTLVAGWPYWLATALAVELAVLHNFWWHEQWTWRSRLTTSSGRIMRLAKYQATTGLTSVGGNLVVTALWVELFGMHPVAANLGAVAMMSAANFLVADRWVFVRREAAAGAVIMVTALTALPAVSSAAELTPQTVAAWNQYVARAEARHAPQRPLASSSDDPEGETIAVPGGTIHRWRGSVMVPGTTVEALVQRLFYPGTPPPQEDVIEPRVLSRKGDSLRVYLKLARSAIVTVTYDTEHEVQFWRHGAGLATSRSVATRIAEVDGSDRGFLWRLNSYWRYVQVGNDVRVELESLSLSRGVPRVLRPVASPIVSRIARESMVRTLESVRRFGAVRAEARALSWLSGSGSDGRQKPGCRIEID